MSRPFSVFALMREVTKVYGLAVLRAEAVARYS
jgi:hypothetical protein